MEATNEDIGVEANLVELYIAEEDDDGWQAQAEAVAEKVVEDFSFCAVGTFLTASVIQFQAMRMTLANLWHPHGGVTNIDPGDKRYMFRFYYEINFERFLQGSPWTFNGHLLVFHCFGEGDDPMSVPLVNVDFWGISI